VFDQVIDRISRESNHALALHDFCYGRADFHSSSFSHGSDSACVAQVLVVIRSGSHRWKNVQVAGPRSIE
jgi:hypothetical protein